MKFEVMRPEIVNKLFKPTKLQSILDAFMQSDELAIRYAMEPGEYANLRSAQCSFSCAIKRYQLPIVTRVIHGDLYLIRVRYKAMPWCTSCLYQYPYSEICHDCVQGNKKVLKKSAMEEKK